MGLTKCPRCELNYILDGGELCTICRDEVRGARTKDDSMLLCSVCGELPALPGEDMCKACLSELRSIELLSVDGDEDTPTEAELNPDPVSSLNEIEEIEAAVVLDDEEDASDALDESDEDGTLNTVDSLDDAALPDALDTLDSDLLNTADTQGAARTLKKRGA